MEKKKKVTISISKNILADAKKRAIDDETNLSAMIEKLLKEHLKNKDAK